MNQASSVRQQIRNLVILFVTAFITACCIVGLLIFSYGVSGSFVLDHVLLSPDVLSKLSYSEGEEFTFDKIEFTYFDPSQAQWSTIPVSLEDYREFYALIAKDRSVAEPDDTRFSRGNPSKLSIWAKPSAGVSGRRMVQEVHFALDGNAYRLELRGQQAGTWAYFEHVKILEAATTIFRVTL